MQTLGKGDSAIEKDAEIGKLLMDTFADLYCNKVNENIVALHLHTNGFVRKGKSLPSVLGVSAARLTLTPEIGFDTADRFERFYLPREAWGC